MENTNSKDQIVTNTNTNVQNVNKSTTDSSENDIEKNKNFRLMSENLASSGLTLERRDPHILLAAIKAGATEFEARVGRPMTYGEMRSMWG
jgi:hypothetical protein